MFSGIVEAVGRVGNVEDLKKGLRLCIEAPLSFKGNIKAGESLAINGACLTISKKNKQKLWFDLSLETLEKTSFKKLVKGEWVNLERSLKVSDRLHGHFVTGHIDGIGSVIAKKQEGAFIKFRFGLPSDLCQDVVEKGSISVDGVSLTVNSVFEEAIEVMIIPETLKRTILGKKRIGDLVQVELDLIGKYIKKWVKR